MKEHRFIKASYESLVDWRTHVDLLRCNPSFRNSTRHDCVLVNSLPRNYFARLLFVFTHTIDSAGQSIDIPLALVLPFKELEPSCAADVELRLLRLKAKHRKEAIIIPAKSIIRGALILPAAGGKSEWLVFDVLDTDMFLRMQLMYPPGDVVH